MSRSLIGVSVAAFVGILAVTSLGGPAGRLRGQLPGRGVPPPVESGCDPAILGWEVEVTAAVQGGICSQRDCASYFNKSFLLEEPAGGAEPGLCTWDSAALAACAAEQLPGVAAYPQEGYPMWQVMQIGGVFLLKANAYNRETIFGMDLPTDPREYGSNGAIVLNPLRRLQLAKWSDVCRVEEDSVEVRAIPVCNMPPEIEVAVQEGKGHALSSVLERDASVGPADALSFHPCRLQWRPGEREVWRVGLVSDAVTAGGGTGVRFRAQDRVPGGILSFRVVAPPPLRIVPMGPAEAVLELQGNVENLFRDAPREYPVRIEATDAKGLSAFEEVHVSLERDACGDGRTGLTEQCDDGNRLGGDGCSVVCRKEGCGNGIQNFGEDCDEGGDTFSCDSDCTHARCGDGRINAAAGEECDDGDRISGDGCSGGCQKEIGCCQFNGSFAWTLPGACWPETPGPVRSVPSREACTPLPVVRLFTQGGWKELPFVSVTTRVTETVVRENSEGKLVEAEIEAPMVDHTLLPSDGPLHEWIARVNERIYAPVEDEEEEEEEEDGNLEAAILRRGGDLGSRLEEQLDRQPPLQQREYDGYCALPGGRECVGVNGYEVVKDGKKLLVDARTVCFTREEPRNGQPQAISFARTKPLCEYYAGIGRYEGVTKFPKGSAALEMFPRDWNLRDFGGGNFNNFPSPPDEF